MYSGVGMHGWCCYHFHWSLFLLLVQMFLNCQFMIWFHFLSLDHHRLWPMRDIYGMLPWQPKQQCIMGEFRRGPNLSLEEYLRKFSLVGLNLTSLWSRGDFKTIIKGLTFIHDPKCRAVKYLFYITKLEWLIYYEYQPVHVGLLLSSRSYHYICYVCLFVCLFNRSVRADTRMGPEGTKLKQKPEPDLKSL